MPHYDWVQHLVAVLVQSTGIAGSGLVVWALVKKRLDARRPIRALATRRTPATLARIELGGALCLFAMALLGAAGYILNLNPMA